MKNEAEFVEMDEELAVSPACPTDQAALAEGARSREPVGEARARAGRIDLAGDGEVATDGADRDGADLSVFGTDSEDVPDRLVQALSVPPGLSAKTAVAPWAPLRTGRRRIIMKENLILLRWPGDAPADSPAAHHYIEALLAPFLAGYRNPTTLRSYRKALRGFSLGGGGRERPPLSR